MNKKTICKICKKIFFVYLSQKKKFCSRKCYHIYQKQYLSGANNSHWKGGKQQSGHGYIRIWLGRHAIPRYIYEHRFVMEKFLKRKLKSNETVHHIDGNSVNNKIKNLKVFASNGQHTIKAHPEVLKKLNG